MNKNDVLKLEIIGMTLQGDGIARHDGVPVFVPGTCPGDVANVRIIKQKPGFAAGKLVEVVTPSPRRADPRCEAYPACGGCAFRCCDYAFELETKQRELRETLRRIGDIAAPLREIVGAASCDGYRNKALLPVEGDRAGFYARHSHRVVPCDGCKLAPPQFQTLTQTVMAWRRRHDPNGNLRHIYLRAAADQTTVCLVTHQHKIPKIDALVADLLACGVPVTGLLCNHGGDANVVLGPNFHTLWGQPCLEVSLAGVALRVSPGAFLQVNLPQAEQLYAIAKDYATRGGGGGHLLDLYCGTGSIGLCMAGAFKTLTGVEIVPQAVKNANENAARNHIANARFLAMDAFAAAEQLAREAWKPDVALLDPPRKGCDAALLRLLATAFAPRRIVYISCAPATLARDLRLLAAYGYATREVAPVDMFPRTGHVECVALVERAT
ncbi:MAG: 23S rRNA (uracil(1939)-C(5))-methyltransferase RlmD [Oscillospiraceae bacterium]|jgi:23S rRNA (uracil1939-C5)-methyltransferase|nr:23S rRNA (uracil(1939)-C(5))-methyltransferase RlmD [Oscillospiraceae bacterium]